MAAAAFQAEHPIHVVKPDRSLREVLAEREPRVREERLIALRSLLGSPLVDLVEEVLDEIDVDPDKIQPQRPLHPPLDRREQWSDDHHTDLYSGKGAGTATCFCAYGLGNTGEANPDFTVAESTDLLQLLPGPIK